MTLQNLTKNLLSSLHWFLTPLHLNKLQIKRHFHPPISTPHTTWINIWINSSFACVVDDKLYIVYFQFSINKFWGMMCICIWVREGERLIGGEFSKEDFFKIYLHSLTIISEIKKSFKEIFIPFILCGEKTTPLSPWCLYRTICMVFYNWWIFWSIKSAKSLRLCTLFCTLRISWKSHWYASK